MIKLNLNVFSLLILLYTILILYLIIFCEYMQLFILTHLIPTPSEILSARNYEQNISASDTARLTRNNYMNIVT